MARRVCVVGAGVVGLCCAIRLAENGYAVDVLARELPLETTSALSGGLWLPPPGEPVQRIRGWARTGLLELAALAAAEVPGVRLVTGHLLHRGPQPGPTPGWAEGTQQRVDLRTVTDPLPGFGSAFRLTVPLLDMPPYLEYLRRRLLAAGGTLTRLPLAALPRRGLVVNCTGLAARALVPDPGVFPVRDQLLLLADPGLDGWWVHEGAGEEPATSVLPHGHRVVVGGTAERGEWSTAADAETGRRLLARACALVPALRTARVLGHRVGLRPARATVRLEAEAAATPQDPDRTLVHCYGHGGSGVTLSWGCAEEVLATVQRFDP